jgi:hypothetical protein
MRDFARRRCRRAAADVWAEADAGAKATRALAQELDIADENQSRGPRALGQADAQIGSDAGRLADRDRDRRSRRQGSNPIFR